ncbi:MAG: polysaccharide deacetylase family protein, partial [Bacteroidetes bacterium]|nr:polysaccharide deacetylase family protein [Bacteroidota bacterium]
MPAAAKNIFLFSVDLEDVRLRMQDGLSYKPRVEALVEKYLRFLNKHRSKATFFTVGDIPEHYPGLIKTIISEGHEIACHSNKHIPVTHQTKEDFKNDLLQNLENLSNAGATNIIGYRAPIYSITEKTSWAFDILSELGFKYSSSVLPAKNPLFGWEDFGEQPRMMNEKLFEIPVSVRGTNFLNVPFSGGVYFRVIPMMLIKKDFEKHFSKGQPVISYFHPYDIDTEQESFMHPGINDSWFYNKLMYFNRKNMFGRLEEIMEEFDCKIITYREYSESIK